jgi:hypothetical protein|tara:strand:- start:432 stop:2297 length:1866 start_codon:yes stop_codon:yes gene_type:complete
MAERTYTVTVASGNLYGGGTGNVFYLDGARNSTGPGTISWVQGGTLRFEQSDGSNDNHPLIFSTNTSTSGIISSGVTYYLDGASNQAAYTNTSSFNAATTRYVEITPSSQTDFYYLCYVHGIGMGGIFDITQSTWGALTWSQGNWSAQNNFTQAPSGISASSTLGTPSYEMNTVETVTGNSATLSINSASVDLLNNGWGANSWGFSEWGQIGQLIVGQALTTSTGTAVASIDVSTSVTGSSASTSIGGNVISINQTMTPTGLSLTSSIGVADAAPDALAVGQSLTTSIGNVTAVGVIEIGWGGDAWGLNQWGELNAPTEAVTTAGLLQTSAGSSTITGNANIDVTGTALTISQGEDISGTSHTELVTTAGLLQMSSESSVVDIGVPVTGISSSMSAGQATIDDTFLIGSGWGRDTFGNLGWGVNYSAINSAGLSLTSSIGNDATVANANVSVTGQALSLTLGTFSVQANADLSITVSEHTMNSSIGSVSLDQNTTESVTGLSLTTSIGTEDAGVRLDVSVTGQSLSSSIGSSSLVQTTTEVVSGQSAALSLGTITQLPAVLVGVSGQSLTTAIGNEGQVTDVAVTLTGQSLTSSVGTPNITPWVEVDLGVTNNWTTVDLAA